MSALTIYTVPLYVGSSLLLSSIYSCLEYSKGNIKIPKFAECILSSWLVITLIIAGLIFDSIRNADNKMYLFMTIALFTISSSISILIFMS